MVWKIKKSAECFIIYLPDTYAEKNIQEISQLESKSIIKVCNFLKVKQKNPLNVYIYPSLAFKKKLIGGSSPAYSNYKKYMVGYVYNKSWSNNIGTCHEETHILSMLWGGRKVELEGKIINSLCGLYEGLAMYTQSVLFFEYFCGYKQVGPPKGMTLNQAIADDIKKNKAPSVFKVLTYEGYSKNLKNGAQLGSFTGYLIDIFGLDIFKKIYLFVCERKTYQENADIFKKILGMSAGKIDSGWKQYVLKNHHFK